MQDIQADTVVSEFKTDKNKLSVWKIENTSDIEDAFIALASNCSTIGTICAAMIPPEELKLLEFDDEEGDTPTIGINHKHCNIIELNYVSLGHVISSILRCVQNQDNMLIRKSRADMKNLLAKAYSQNKLDTTRISPSVLDEIKKVLTKKS